MEVNYFKHETNEYRLQLSGVLNYNLKFENGEQKVEDEKMIKEPSEKLEASVTSWVE